MKTLVVWDGARSDLGRLRRAEATSVVAWTEDAADALRAAAIPHRTLASLLDPDAQDRIDQAAIAWTKAWGTRPMLDGRAFRDLYSWKGVSLWWFAELYLHHSTPSTRYVRWVETFHRLLDLERPDEVEAAGLSPEQTVLLARTCVARGVLFHGRERLPLATTLGLRGRSVRRSLESRRNTVKALVTALKSRLAGSPPVIPSADRAVVLFLSHAAFWRRKRDPERGTVEEYEHYFDRLIPEAARQGDIEAVVVAVGPKAAHRRRGTADRLTDWLSLPASEGPYRHVNRFCGPAVLREVRRISAEMRRAWRVLRNSPGVHQAFSHRGVAFADLAAPDLAGTLLLQVPWAVRSYEEMGAALDHLRPRAVCLYAESSGWGRAAVAAARSRGIATVAVQHGILYPKYYSYLHGPEDAGCPRPDRTAVFGEAARRFLIEEGAYPPASLVVTGSPKFDDLLSTSRSWDRAAVRRRLGVDEGGLLLVVASRYRGIRETHQSIGSAFSSLLAAVEAMPEVHCLVKPHPAEPADAYERDIRRAGATRVRVLPSGYDLMELLHAADALVTVESLSAVEALVLGRPVLILNMPTNLGSLVDQGVALGVRAGEDPLSALRELLFDPATRSLLKLARERYLSDVAAGVDGQATARILRLLKEVAGAGAEAARDGLVAGHGRV
jgi:CDP-Glycerol:Poly(glycerophosphate) glycerophosphotransferase